MITEMRCVLCDKMVHYKYQLTPKNEEIVMWFHCSCGCVFNIAIPEKIYTKEYQEGYAKLKDIKARYNYYIRTYVPLIEELTYGRKFLDVGHCLDYNIDEMKERGWISTGIDLIENKYITGDFEDFDFGSERFDLIFMCDVITSFKDPVKAFKRAYDLLSPSGIMLLVTPNSDMLLDSMIFDFGHWNLNEHRLFFSERNLIDMAQRVDSGMKGKFKVIMKHNSVSKRFISYNNIHMILQKQKIEMLRLNDEKTT